jgi:hypothetical protein
MFCFCFGKRPYSYEKIETNTILSSVLFSPPNLNTTPVSKYEVQNTASNGVQDYYNQYTFSIKINAPILENSEKTIKRVHFQ